MTPPPRLRIAAEALGTAFLLCTVIGSGIMGAKLASGNVAVALLANSLATGAILVVLILIFAPVSGAHFNPAVSLAMAIRGALPFALLAPYVLAQTIGAIAGVGIAHAMFDLPILQTARTVRTGAGQWIAEIVATFGLLTTIIACARHALAAIHYAVGLYIVAAYWFTASTSFANPAVTMARAFSDTFAGIAPASVPGFVVAQLIGMIAALAAARHFWPRAA